jgi:hypothetical protein
VTVAPVLACAENAELAANPEIAITPTSAAITPSRLR